MQVKSLVTTRTTVHQNERLAGSIPAPALEGIYFRHLSHLHTMSVYISVGPRKQLRCDMSYLYSKKTTVLAKSKNETTLSIYLLILI